MKVRTVPLPFEPKRSCVRLIRLGCLVALGSSFFIVRAQHLSVIHGSRVQLSSSEIDFSGCELNVMHPIRVIRVWKPVFADHPDRMNAKLYMYPGGHKELLNRRGKLTLWDVTTQFADLMRVRLSQKGFRQSASAERIALTCGIVDARVAVTTWFLHLITFEFVILDEHWSTITVVVRLAQQNEEVALIRATGHPSDRLSRRVIDWIAKRERRK